MRSITFHDELTLGFGSGCGVGLGVGSAGAADIPASLRGGLVRSRPVWRAALASGDHDCMRITTDDGVSLAVETAGEGPGLMLVHGFGGAKEDFADHVPALARDHTVVVFDHRGHGASDKPADATAYSVDRLAADIVQVADGAGLESFRLLGHSMGGMVARKVALRERERVDALIMMDTSPGPVPGFDPSLMESAARVALDQGKDALQELLEMAPVLETPAYQRMLRERPGYQEFQERKFADMSAVMWGAMALALARQDDDLPAMTALECAVLVLVGEQDEPFVIASNAMAAAIPRAQLVVIPDAGHSPQFENPVVWFDALSKFLSSLPAAAR
jgi:pimeloyl-ACP methyl ester carboxylesterase